MSRRKGQRERKANSLLSRELDMGSIPGPQDHDLSQRQMLNQLSHPGALRFIRFYTKSRVKETKN